MFFLLTVLPTHDRFFSYLSCLHIWIFWFHFRTLSDGRHAGGRDAASARYIFTHLAPLTRALFRPEDDAILTYGNSNRFFIALSSCF